MLELLLFRHTGLIQIFYLNISMSPIQKATFLRIGHQLFKYQYGQLPNTLNMFSFVKKRSVHITIFETRTNSDLILLSMHTKTETYVVLVYMFEIIYVTIYILPHHSLHLKGYSKNIISDKICF